MYLCDQIVPVMDQRGAKKYVCPVCQEDMCTEGELTKHIRSHNTTAALNTCKICNKVLSSQSSLDRHMLVHSGKLHTHRHTDRQKHPLALHAIYTQHLQNLQQSAQLSEFPGQAYAGALW